MKKAAYFRFFLPKKFPTKLLQSETLAFCNAPSKYRFFHLKLLVQNPWAKVKAPYNQRHHARKSRKLKKKNKVSVHSFRVPDLQTLSFPQIGTAS
jgi:hypothetical protein